VIVPNSRPTDLLIADEAHKLKNSKTKLLVTLSAFKSRRRVLLTGTVSFSLSICLP
jgi:SNF2 family DNA or RNA helicase